MAVASPETQALVEETRQLCVEVEEDIRELQRVRRLEDSRHVVSTSVARVGVLGLVLVLVAGLLGLRAGVLAAIAAVALGVAVILLDRPAGRSE